MDYKGGNNQFGTHSSKQTKVCLEFSLYNC